MTDIKESEVIGCDNKELTFLTLGADVENEIVDEKEKVTEVLQRDIKKVEKENERKKAKSGGIGRVKKVASSQKKEGKENRRPADQNKTEKKDCAVSSEKEKSGPLDVDIFEVSQYPRNYRTSSNTVCGHRISSESFQYLAPGRQICDSAVNAILRLMSINAEKLGLKVLPFDTFFVLKILKLKGNNYAYTCQNPCSARQKCLVFPDYSRWALDDLADLFLIKRRFCISILCITSLPKTCFAIHAGFQVQSRRYRSAVEEVGNALSPRHTNTIF